MAGVVGSMKRLKETIKQDIVAFLLICFLIGTGFIWIGAAYHLMYLSDGEKLNATVLWLTALAIFWYAYETYQLKMNTSEQVDIQEVIMQNEFLPILEPISAKGKQGALRNGRLSSFEVRNLGRGPAKYIEIHIGKLHTPLEWSLAEHERKSVQLPVDMRREVATLLQNAPATVNLRLTYQDIYKRKFQTQNIIFDRLPRGGYTLRQGTWDFKRVRKIRGAY